MVSVVLDQSHQLKAVGAAGSRKPAAAGRQEPIPVNDVRALVFAEVKIKFPDLLSAAGVWWLHLHHQIPNPKAVCFPVALELAARGCNVGWHVACNHSRAESEALAEEEGVWLAFFCLMFFGVGCFCLFFFNYKRYCRARGFNVLFKATVSLLLIDFQKVEGRFRTGKCRRGFASI